MNDLLLSCDWGTSSFRLRLVDRTTGRVAGGLVSAEGAAIVYNQWMAGGAGEAAAGEAMAAVEAADRETFYLRKLVRHIDALSEKLAIPLHGIPVVMSGMIGSSIGIRELPYATLPFAMDGSGVIVRELSVGKEIPHPVWLISGVSHRLDVMRGEETQLIGLASMNEQLRKAGNSVCIIPGTHSKHIRIRDGHVIGFKTYMTGEFFHLLRHHSILKDSISGDGYEGIADDIEKEAFCRGVGQSGDAELLHSVFSIRVNQLIGGSSNRENFFHLSGLLIGTELRGLGEHDDALLRLCSGSSVFHLYQLAMEALGFLPRTVFIPPDIMDNSAAAGHARILKNITDQ